MDENLLELEQRRMIDKVREKVEVELKRRYMWLGLIVAAITGGMITLLVNSLLTDAQVSIATTKEFLKQAGDKLANVEATSDSLEKQFTRVRQQIEGLNQIAVSINDQFTKISKTNLELSDGLHKEIAGLSTIVGKLMTSRTPENTAVLKGDIGKIDDSLRESKANIDNTKETFLKSTEKTKEQINVQKSTAFY